MAQGVWNVNNYPSTATAASAAKAAPSSGDPGLVNRCRTLTFSASGAAAAPTGIIECVVRDGGAGVGTIIWSGTLQAASNDSAVLSKENLDLRASAGNALTAETTGAGAAGTQLAVSMSGDLVQIGVPGWNQ